MEELERVVLLTNMPDHNLEQGDVGMIVHVYPERKGYEVEFVTLNGNFLALVTVFPEQIRPVQADEIAHVRAVRAA